MQVYTKDFVSFVSEFNLCFCVNRSNTEGGSPEDAIVVETGSDEKESLTDSLPSLCLKQVFPKYTKQFNYLRVVERIAAIFLRFLGVKGNMRLGPTGFRTFIRQVISSLYSSTF